MIELALIGFIVIFIVIAICTTKIKEDGNTELRITYEGKVPVDSVVIYKKKAHETE